MFFAFLASVSAVKQSFKISTQGFYTLAMEQGDELTLTLDNKTAFFYHNIKDVLYMTKNDDNFKLSKHAKLNVLDYGSYQIAMNKASSLYFWVLDKSICETNAFFLETENSMKVNWKIPETNEPLCFFIQPHFSSSYIVSSIESDPGAQIEADFRDSSNIVRSQKKCENTKKCVRSFKSPFFFRLKGGSGKELSLKFDVHDPSPSVKSCSFTSLNKSIDVSKAQVFCNTIIADMMIYVYGAAFLLIVVVLIFVTNKYIISMLCKEQLNIKFNDLKNDPYAAPLAQPNGEAAE